MINALLASLYTALFIAGMKLGIQQDYRLPIVNADLFWWNIGAAVFGLFAASFFGLMQIATHLSQRLSLSNMLVTAMAFVNVLQAVVFWLWKTVTFMTLLHLVASANLINSLFTIANLLLFHYEFKHFGKPVFLDLLNPNSALFNQNAC